MNNEFNKRTGSKCAINENVLTREARLCLNNNNNETSTNFISDCIIADPELNSIVDSMNARVDKINSATREYNREWASVPKCRCA